MGFSLKERKYWIIKLSSYVIACEICSINRGFAIEWWDGKENHAICFKCIRKINRHLEAKRKRSNKR